MTGQGQARLNSSLGLLKAELRTVNNRGLKLTTRLNDSLAFLESRVEAFLRARIHRGSVQVRVGWQRNDVVSNFHIQQDVLASYYRQLNQVRSGLEAAAPIDLTRLALLPGVIVENDEEGPDEETIWASLESLLSMALENLDEMRDQEGTAMAETLEKDLQHIQTHLHSIMQRAPNVCEAYRERLQTKVDGYLASKGLDLAKVDILREVQLFADRSDISEEATRLEAHFQAFAKHLAATGANGRKLDFVIQEMFRETNTIGSKASDAAISADVVEIKCALERMRELVQNIE